MAQTKIEWCDYTVNPVVGCSKCSPGCDNCYAERIAARMAKHPSPKIREKYAPVIGQDGKWNGFVSFDANAFKVPSTKRGFFANQPGSPPLRIFIGSMGDVFHPTISKTLWSHDPLDAILGLVCAHPDHTFMLLTKRLEEMSSRMGVFEDRSFGSRRPWPRPGRPRAASGRRLRRNGRPW